MSVEERLAELEQRVEEAGRSALFLSAQTALHPSTAVTAHELRQALERVGRALLFGAETKGEDA